MLTIVLFLFAADQSDDVAKYLDASRKARTLLPIPKDRTPMVGDIGTLHVDKIRVLKIINKNSVIASVWFEDSPGLQKQVGNRIVPVIGGKLYAVVMENLDDTSKLATQTEYPVPLTTVWQVTEMRPPFEGSDDRIPVLKRVEIPKDWTKKSKKK